MTQSMIELKVPVPVRTFGATVTIEGELPTFRSGGIIYPHWNLTEGDGAPAWNSTDTYLTGDVVTRSGHTYRATTSVPANRDPAVLLGFDNFIPTNTLTVDMHPDFVPTVTVSATVQFHVANAPRYGSVDPAYDIGCPVSANVPAGSPGVDYQFTDSGQLGVAIYERNLITNVVSIAGSASVGSLLGSGTHYLDLSPNDHCTIDRVEFGHYDGLTAEHILAGTWYPDGHPSLYWELLANETYWGSGVGTREKRFLVYIGPSGLPFSSITDDMMSEVSAIDVDYVGPTDTGGGEIPHPAFDHAFGHAFTLGGAGYQFTLSNLRLDNFGTHLRVDYSTTTGIPLGYVRFYGGNLLAWGGTGPLTGGLYGTFGDLGVLAPGSSGTLTLEVGGLYGSLPRSQEIYDYYLVLLARDGSGSNISGLDTVGSTYDASPRNAFRVKDAIRATAANFQSLYIKYAPETLPAGAPQGVAIYNVTVDGYVTTLDLGPHSTTASFS